MHIAFWSPAWPMAKFQNGIITYVHWMKRELEQRGHKVSVFAGEVDPSTSEPGIHHVRYARPSSWDQVVLRLLRLWRPRGSEVFDFARIISAEILKVHQREPIDVVEMEESFGWFAEVGRLTSIPVLVKLHGPAFLSLVEDELDTAFAREKIEREGRALRLATAIISPSERTLRQTVERYALSPKVQRHIVNPLTMDSDTPLWRLDACDRNTILFVGRFDLRKGADVVLKAFLCALKVRPELKLIFVGPDRGLTASDGTRIRFQEYCDLLFPTELRGHVDFRGPMANREIAKLRAQAMMTVVASRWENAGYTVLEAMFQGCPLVSTDAGGCPESVINGVTGRLAKSEDPLDFANQMFAVLDDPKGAEALGQAARRHIIDHHSSARVAAATIEMYEEAIANRRR
jgi:glycosyltransferase involved in cell wall biosynthesis